MTWQPGTLAVALCTPAISPEAWDREKREKLAVAETRSMRARLKPRTLAPPLPVARPVAPAGPVADWRYRAIYPWKLWHEHRPSQARPTPTSQAAATDRGRSGIVPAADKPVGSQPRRTLPMPIPIKTPLDARLSSPLSIEDELAQLRAENAALRARSQSKLTLKVGQAGGLSVYGMGRFPVTLYKSQWLRLLSFAGDISAFIQANDAQLKDKA